MTRCGRSLALPWSLALLALAGTSALQAAANLQILTLVENDPTTLLDDVVVQTDIRWGRDDIPLQMLAWRPIGGTFIPFTANINNIPDYDVQQAYNRSVQAWNGIKLNGEGGVARFEWQPFVIPTDFFAQANLINPAGLVELDGYNELTFYDGAFVGDALGVTSPYVALRDFNVFDFLPPNFEVPVDFISPAYAGGLVDLDGDGFIDTRLPRSEYKRGEMLEMDIGFTTATPFVNLPLDPDDIPDPVFQDTVFGANDLQLVATHELGHGLGLAHTYLFEPTMFPFLTEDTNPYDKREIGFDDAVAVALTYPGGGLDSLGTIVGALISGDQADGLNPDDGTAQPPDPALEFLFQNPVFVGIPDPGFDLVNTPQLSGIVPTEVPSERGAVKLLSWVYTGRDVTFPATSFSRGPTDYNSEFVIPGLAPRTDYRLYTLPQPGGFNEVAFNAVIESFPAEFFGGAPPTTFGTGSRIDRNSPTDNRVENTFIQIAAATNGQFTIGFDGGVGLLFGHPTPATSFTTVRVISGEKTVDYTNQFDAFGNAVQAVTLSDANNTVVGLWRVDPGLQIRESLSIVDAVSGPDTAHDVQITYDLTNVTDATLSAGVRLMLDTIAGSSDRNPFLIDGREYTTGTIFEGPSVPGTYEIVNPTFPHVTAEGRLIGSGATTPSRFVLGPFPNLFDSEWTIDPSGSFSDPLDLASDGAVAIFFDPAPIAPGETRTLTTFYGGFDEDPAEPETGIALGSANVSGEVSRFGDDPLGVEPITVEAGQITGPVNIFTNTGIEPPNLGGTPGTGGIEPPPDPSFEPPPDRVYPVDQDASIVVDVADVDNDGDLDIVYANTLVSGHDPSAAINRLYLNGGYHNELPIGNFIDATFGPNGVPDGPPPIGDDRLPVVYDSDPFTPGFQGALVNESTAGVKFADFDGDGYVDLYFSNFATSASVSGAQNRIFMNRQGTFAGDTFRGFVDETLGVGGPPREPGLLNIGPFVPFAGTTIGDFSFRCDVGDIDADGDIDIVVQEDGGIIGGPGGSFRVPNAPTATPTEFFFRPLFDMRILINDGQGFFRDDTLGADNQFGGRPRFTGEIPGLSIEGSADRDRIPPLMWDYNPAAGSGNQADSAIGTKVVLGQFGGDPNLDIMQISSRHSAFNPPTTDGQEQLFENIGNGYFANVTWGDPPVDGPFYYVGGVHYTSDYVTDPDINDAFPAWDGLVLPFYAPGLIGYPDTFEADRNPSPTTDEVDQLPFPVEDDSYGGAAVDLDNDGDPDLVLANMGEQNQIITFATGTNNNSNENAPFGGIFEPLVPTENRLPFNILITYRAVNSSNVDRGLQIGAKTVRCRDVSLGDVDLDGDPDAYFAVDGVGYENIVSGAATDLLFLNNGQGDLIDDVSSTVLIDQQPLPTFDVKLADVDNDGDLDAVLAVFTQRNMYLENFLINGPVTPLDGGDMPMFTDGTAQYLLNSILGTSVPGTPAAYTNVTSCMQWADFDNDGDYDIYLGNGLQSLSDSNFMLINTGAPLNDGVRVFKAPHVAFPAPQLIQGIGLFGISGEGGCDSDLNGTVDIPGASAPTTDLITADFDGDGDYDEFVVNNGVTNRLMINFDSDEIGPGSPLDRIENLSGGVGIVRVSDAVTSRPDTDFLGDALMIDTTGLSLPGPGPLDPSTTNPNTFGRPDSLTAPLELSRGAAAGDLNGDGRIDLFVANGAAGSSGVRNTLLINQGIRNNSVVEFQAVNDPFDDGHFSPETLNVLDSYDARIFDIDNDGDLDIYVADNSVTSDVEHTIWINRGDGHFDGHTQRIRNLDGTIHQNTVELLVGDFDGDGEPTEDLNGNGYLDPGEDTDGDGVIDFLDLNGNGRHDADYDVLLCNVQAANILLINDGHGNFTDESDERLPTEDSNRNGSLDPGEDLNGDGQIGPVIRDTQDAAMADVDLDGDLDIVLSDDSPTGLAGTDQAITVELLINDGDGVFTDVTRHEVGTTAFSAHGATGAPSNLNANSRVVEFGDADGDGDPDLFVGNLGLLNAGELVGAYNVLLINRTIGANLNARSIRGIPPGFSSPPVVRTVTPATTPVGPPHVLWVTINGFNIQQGATVVFGQGIDVLETRWILPNEIRAKIRVNDDAMPGPRAVTVRNPDGLAGQSQTGAFSLSVATEADLPITAVRRSTWAVYR